jgi:hypothetical protein
MMSLLPSTRIGRITLSLVSGFIAVSAGDALAQSIDPAVGVAQQLIEVGDVSWPVVIMFVGYHLKGWSPTVTIRHVHDEAECGKKSH